MLKPVPVYDVRNQPVQWGDQAPYESWAGRLGRAKYELMKLDGLNPDEDDKEDGPRPSWMAPRTSRDTPLSVLNYPAEALTVKEREESGASGRPRTIRTWVKTSRRKGRPAAARPEET